MEKRTSTSVKGLVKWVCTPWDNPHWEIDDWDILNALDIENYEHKVVKITIEVVEEKE